MAGSYPFSKFDKSDYIRIPGRKFKNILTGDVISRRQFDQHYGQVKFFGTYEKKAKVKAAEENALLRPARGRKSALKLDQSKKEVEKGKRRILKEETEADKLVAKLAAKKVRAPHSFTLRNFRKGTSSRRFAVPVDQAEIESIRAAGEKSKIIISYLVGLTFVDQRGRIRAVSQFSARYIGDEYTPEDFEEAKEIAGNKSSYRSWAGMWMQVILKRSAGEKNGKRYPHAQQTRRKS